jgi:hypothetical protein
MAQSHKRPSARLTFPSRLKGMSWGALGGGLYGGVGGLGIVTLVLSTFALLTALMGLVAPFGGPAAGLAVFNAFERSGLPPVPGLSAYENSLTYAAGVIGMVGVISGLVSGLRHGPDRLRVTGPIPWGLCGAAAGAAAGAVLWLVWPAPNLLFQQGGLQIANGAGVGVLVAGMEYDRRYDPTLG